MKILIIFFSVLFSLHYFQYFKIKRKIKAAETYSELYKNFIEHYIKYNNLFIEKKFKNCPTTVKILNQKFKTIDVLTNCHSFKNITYISSKNKSDKKKKAEFKSFIKERQSFTPEIENFFKKMIDLQVLLLKSTNKTMYYLYVYNLKVKIPFLLGVINFLRTILEKLIIHLNKCEKQQQYLKNAEETKKLKECFS